MEEQRLLWIFSYRELVYGLGFGVFTLFTFAPVLIFRRYGELPSYLLNDEGVYESIAAVCVLAASILLFRHLLQKSPTEGVTRLRSEKSYLLFAFACGLFLLFLEEISWGQQLIGMETPAFIKEVNYQGELNLHNLTLIQDANNSLSSQLFRFLRFCLTYGIILLWVFPSLRALAGKLRVPVPSLYIALLALCAERFSRMCYSGIYGSGYKLDPEFNDTLRVGEIFEGNIEILLLVYVLEIVWSKPKKL